MTIFNELVERTSNGETFYINFEKRTMKVGNDFLVKDGEYDRLRILLGKDKTQLTTNMILYTIECLYENYKYSIPTKRSECKRKTYFNALKMDKIPDEKMVMERRDVAQAKLEGYVLCMILNGSLVWDENVMGRWFWQSNEDKDLVILKQWIENN